MIFTDAEHIREMINDKSMELLTSDVSALAESILESFPMGYSLPLVEWSLVPHTVLQWDAVTDDQTALWASTTLAGRCPFGLVFFRPDQPCVIGKFDFMIRNFDTIIWQSYGFSFLLGVYRNEDGSVQFTRGIIEYDGKGRLYASMEGD